MSPNSGNFPSIEEFLFLFLLFQIVSVLCFVTVSFEMRSSTNSDRFDIGATQLLNASDESADHNGNLDSCSDDLDDDPNYEPGSDGEDYASEDEEVDEHEDDYDEIDEFEDHMEEFQQALGNRTPKKTSQNNDWALHTYARWRREEAPKKDAFVKIPFQFTEIPINRLNYVLSRFVIEARDTNGELFKSTTLYNIVAALNRVLRERHTGTNEDFDLLRTPKFRRFAQVLDGVMKERQQSEDPRTRKVDIFTQQDYEKLWLVIGSNKNPEILLTTFSPSLRPGYCSSPYLQSWFPQRCQHYLYLHFPGPAHFSPSIRPGYCSSPYLQSWFPQRCQHYLYLHFPGPAHFSHYLHLECPAL